MALSLGRSDGCPEVPVLRKRCWWKGLRLILTSLIQYGGLMRISMMLQRGGFWRRLIDQNMVFGNIHEHGQLFN